MRSLGIALFSVLIGIVLSGCTSSTALEPQDTVRVSNAARIYFIRPSAIIGSGQTARIRINEKEVGSLGIGTYLHVDRPAGEYRIAVDHPFDFGKTELTATISPDKDYYFKIYPGPSKIALVGANVAAGSNKLGIADIDAAQAKALMNEMGE